jgi:hypothetical protein
MQNVKFEVNGKVLTISVDLDAAPVRSASGKSNVIASTKGNQPVPGTDVICGLNLYRKV